ncbi:DUF1566 domain-containing protein [Legionella sp. 31fI33]|uniref:DUF1566 domain-containing protein n=1 Tax=Legionella sp. 31fI33 TaxID=2886376 RepID=UPI001E5B5B4C|nr:DUF1566 domain-containing protein [Legionella sp. 31fI33]MCC5014934.1 DUF1566 domain-containing protein [Legionella sp. 31fI33]
MKIKHLIQKMLMGIYVILITTLAYAGKPLWTFIPLTDTTVILPLTGAGTVKYKVTNQSQKSHTLVMTTIPGIVQATTAGNCSNPFVLGYQESCILTLTIDGGALSGNVKHGPIVCEQFSSSLCYQPSEHESLNIIRETAVYSTIGGSVFGLLGTLVLQNNGGDVLTMNADGPFTFSNSLPPGSPYLVTVQTQPATQTCTVSNGSGITNKTDVTNITVNCSTNTHTVGGTLSGLSGTVVLQNNGTDNLPVNNSGSFTFSTPVAQGAGYNVTVLAQPATQTCTVTNGSGSVGTTDIASVQVNCADNAFNVGGTVSGLSGTVVLQNNGTDDLFINNNGSYTFSTQVAQGAGYNVSILTQPVTQTCTITNGSGTMGGMDVTNVDVNCINNTILSTSITDLALSVNNTVLNAALTGTARVITLRNTGSFAAVNLNITPPTWPTGTTSITTCGNTLTAGNDCTITITPGSTATSNGTNPCSNGTAPIAGEIQITANNANSISTNVVVLSYGCIYQGGYLFSVNDSTPNTSSIKGKVAATSDEATLQWATVSNDTGADSNSNGLANTTVLETPAGQYPAAQACSNKTTQGYSDWYLPAICEMGYDGSSDGSGCGSGGAPLLQNLYSNLKTNGNIGGFGTAIYWSSTEASASPLIVAWLQLFINGSQTFTNKTGNFRIRCVRSF